MSNNPAVINADFSDDGSIVEGEELSVFNPDPNAVFITLSDLDGINNVMSTFDISWYRHENGTVNIADLTVDDMVQGPGWTSNYFVTEQDVGSYISVRVSFTDDLDNFEFRDFTTSSPVADAPNSPAVISISLAADSGEFVVGASGSG